MPRDRYIEKVKDIKISELKKITPYLDDLELPPRMRKFAWYYVFNGFCPSDAAVQAGYNTKNKVSLSVIASQNLNKVRIKEAIKRIIENAISIEKGTLEKKIFEAYWKRAFYDINTFQNKDGSYIPLDKIPEADRVVVDNVEEKYWGKDADTKTVVLKLANRDTALDKLSKYIGIMNDKLDLGIKKISKEARNNLREIFEDKPLEDIDEDENESDE